MEVILLVEDKETLLLLFDEHHPCWTPLMLARAGVDEELVERLVEERVLLKEDGVYSLTEEGRSRFVRAAAENFLPLHPGDEQGDRKLTAARSELRMLLDRRHLQRWGLKEYMSPFEFSIPDAADDALFAVRGGQVEWRHQDLPVFEAMRRDFPSGMAARKLPAPTPERIAAWLDRFMPLRRTMTMDLLYKSRYDFQSYASVEPLASDPCSLLDTDRFLFSFAPNPLPENKEYFLRKAGEFQMFLTMLRHLYLPGFTDLDSMEQDSIDWLVFTFRHEAEAQACAELLRPLPEAPGGPAAPSEVWSLSFEALQGSDEVAETVWDLLPYTAHPIRRVGPW